MTSPLMPAKASAVVPAVAPAGGPVNGVKHPCVWCGYELSGLAYKGKSRTCPECGKQVSDEDLYRFRRIPPLRPALLWICGPSYVAAAAVWIADAMRTGATGPMVRNLFIARTVLVALIVLWALAAPPIVATRRSNRCGRSPMGTVDETILGWALTIGVPVMALFIRLLVKVTLKV